MNLERFDDLSATAKGVAEFLRARVDAVLTHAPIVRIALSGGSTPQSLHRIMAGWDVPWERFAFYFGDERCVPLEHEESNAGMARASLFEPAGIADTQWHRMRGELEPDEAARQYEQLLREAFPNQTLPRFDIVLLGLGNDGHTASLFPGTKALDESERWVVANHVPKLDTMRITLTYPAINSADLGLFMITGADKATALRAVLEGDALVEHIPARGITPKGDLRFFVDHAAAALLSVD